MQSNKIVMADKMLPPVRPTKEQREWVEGERTRTGASLSTVIRALLQEKVDAKKMLDSKSMTE